MRDLRVFNTVHSLRERLASEAREKPVCFVPTMGALHHGHLNLVKQAFKLSDLVVVSIFVNPTQFNNPADLANYPRTLEADLESLASVGDVLVFAPTVDEMYPPDFREIDLDLGALETVMEGAFRPGHFKGVVNVVKRLFDIVEPDYAFFGLKDYQQLAVIRYMVQRLGLGVAIIPCETIREPDGLASSSRNLRLSEQDLVDARILHDTISFARTYSPEHNPEETRKASMEYFSRSPLELEYLEIVDPDTLQPIEQWVPGARMCIAAYCGEIRLIDNDAVFGG